jgi:DNA polymerase Ligase (LigD)
MVSQDSNPREWRFAILRHTRQQEVHWDLLLELPGRELLATWQVYADPAVWTNSATGDFLATVRALPDHRRTYLDYEGPISADRGQVQRVEEGRFRLLTNEAGKIVLELTGKRLQARLELVLADSAASLWQLHVTPL